MKIGFYTVLKGGSLHYRLADILIASCRKAMPDVPVVMFTNETSPAIQGVDEVRRLPDAPMALLRTQHHAACEGDWLFVDTDVVIQRDVRSVFDEPFDVAVCDRKWPHVPMHPSLAQFNQAMPYNIGVIFSRCPAFWTDVATWIPATPKTIEGWNSDWMGDQWVACQVIASGKFHVKVLPGQVYNYPPMTAQEDLSGAAILHFKGNRKQMMLERFA